MLLDIPLPRLNLIKELEKDFVTILFSNTNDIHLKEVFNICKQENGFDSFTEYFDKEYYSHLFGKRKPDPEAFLAILHENRFNAEETLFVDDSLQHVLGARSAGIHAVHITNDKSIFDVVSFINEINLVYAEEQSERKFSFAS